jgi:hypothetical protein
MASLLGRPVSLEEVATRVTAHLPATLRREGTLNL